MEIPIPPSVNLSPLEALLAKSRQIMNVVESTMPVKQVSNSKVIEDDEVDSYSSRSNSRPQIQENYGYDERDEREMTYESYNPTPSSEPRMYTAEQVMASNLPPAVKAAMINNPIPQFQVPPSKVTAEAISKITGAPIRSNEPRRPINENRQGSDMITISKSELKDMINEGISTFFKQVYDKTLTEETIRKTINVLIKEGKINVKKRV
jgi:hypothetical protein